MPRTLSLPEISDNAYLNPITRPSQIKAWLHTLPFEKPLEAVRIMSDGLSTLNRVKISSDTRFELAEIYRSSISVLWPSLESIYRTSALPLSADAQLAAKLAKVLAEEMGYSYKILLTQHLNKRLKFGGSKHSALLMKRVQHALARILSVGYHTYSVPAPGVWIEMHRIYQCAIENDLHTELTLDAGPERSIGLRYKQALLLAAADPFRITRGDFARILDYLRHYAHLVRLTHDVPANNSAASMFLIRPTQDSPPKPISKINGAYEPGDLFLNTFDLALTLHQQLNKLENGVDPQKLGLPNSARDPSYTELIRRLIKQWAITPKRTFNRLRSNSRIEICVGMYTIWYYANGEKPYTNPDYRQAQPANTQALAKGKNERRFYSSEWIIINESPGGYALRQISGCSMQLHVGEIIALRGDTNSWQIGVIRWVHSTNPDSIELGVQVLAPTVVPVAVKPTISAANQTYVSALLLPEIPSLKRPASLMAPYGTFYPERPLLIERDGETHIVKAEQLIEQTANAEYFRFSEA